MLAYRLNSDRENLIITYNEKELNETSEAVIEMHASRVYQVAYDYTYWDDFVAFASNPDPQWAAENISTILSSFHFHGAWMINLNHQVVFKDFDSTSSHLIDYQFSDELIKKLNTERFVNYFVRTTQGLLQIQGATVHPTADPERLTEPRAYFFLAVYWDRDMLHSIGKISGCEVLFTDQKADPEPLRKKGVILDYHTVCDWDGNEAGHLEFKKELAFINLYREFSDQWFWLMIVLAVIFLFSLSLLLSNLVTRPLRLVTEIIQKESLEKIPRLKKNSKDFERIGIVLEQFLEQKVELVKAIELSMASDQLKSDFLNNISHEIRTPLNGILGATSLLSEDNLSDETRAEMTVIMNLSTRRLLRTVTLYMDMSLLNTNNMPVEIKEFKLSDMLTPLLEEFEEDCKLTSLDFKNSFTEDYEFIFLRLDSNLLNKVLGHLLDNAVKFTEKGQVKFSYSIEGNAIRFDVEDTGIGIHESAKSRLFDFFMQEDSSKIRRYDGSGLGLAICRKICDQLDGNIWFESEKGKGSVFHLSFNEAVIIRLPESIKTLEPVKEISFQPLILIAEDEATNYQILELMLKRDFDARLIWVRDGREAVNAVQLNPLIDLVFMDIRMPVMDGFEATRQIKAASPGLPIIALTAFGSADDERLALAAGANAYVAKPFRKHELMKIVRDLLETNPTRRT